MKIKITRAQLDELIKEEVQRAKRIQELEERKKQLNEVLRRIDEGENLDELLGGFKNLFSKGAQSAGKGLGNAWNGIKTGAKAIGNDALNVGKSIAKGAQAIGNDMHQGATDIGNAATDVFHGIKKTYQQGEANQAVIDAQKNLNKIYAQKRMLDQKIQSLQTKHKELTGQLYQPTRLNYKAPVAAPINYQRKSTVPTTNLNNNNSQAA